MEWFFLMKNHKLLNFFDAVRTVNLFVYSVAASCRSLRLSDKVSLQEGPSLQSERSDHLISNYSVLMSVGAGCQIWGSSCCDAAVLGHGFLGKPHAVLMRHLSPGSFSPPVHKSGDSDLFFRQWIAHCF